MNIYQLPILPLSEEFVTVLKDDGNIRIERIVSTGQVTDWYDQEEAEFVTLIQGEGEIEYKEKPSVSLKAGDCLFIPPHLIHRVAETSSKPPCIWLCFFWKSS